MRLGILELLLALLVVAIRPSNRDGPSLDLPLLSVPLGIAYPVRRLDFCRGIERNKDVDIPARTEEWVACKVVAHSRILSGVSNCMETPNNNTKGDLQGLGSDAQKCWVGDKPLT